MNHYDAQIVTSEQAPYHQRITATGTDIDDAFTLLQLRYPGAVEYNINRKNRFGDIVDRRKAGDRWEWLRSQQEQKRR